MTTENDKQSSSSKRRRRQAFGAVRQLPSGRWQARYRDKRGRLVAAPHTFPIKTDATRYLAVVEADHLRGSFHDPKRGETRFGVWADQWMKGAGRERSPEMRFASPAQINALAAEVAPCYRALVLLAGYCGLRWGELVGLRRHRLDLEARTVAVAEQMTEIDGHLRAGSPKSEAGKRAVTMPRFVADALSEHLATWAEEGAKGLVFPAPEGGLLRRSNFRRRVWLPATEAVGVEGLRFHDLRHSAATLAAAAGATTKELMARIGHSSYEAAIRYQHVVAERDAAIADAWRASARSDRSSRGRSATEVARTWHAASGRPGGGQRTRPLTSAERWWS